MGRIALVIVLACVAPGCATAVASALHGNAATMRAAADADVAVANAAVRALTSGGATSSSSRSSGASGGVSYGSEPPYECSVPGEDEPQTLAASSLEGAIATCEAMNAMPEGTSCTCREMELGSALSEPIAER